MRKNGALFNHALRITGACVPLAWFALSAQVAHGQAAPAASHARYDNFITNYCQDCHNAEDWAGGLALDILDVREVGAEPAVWEKSSNKLRGRLMPPAGAKQPSQADVDALIAYLESSADASAGNMPVGHVPIQRLNRTEFAATVRALIGVDIDARQALPTEVEIDGFSNIAQALAISPSFMEQYLSATRRAVRLAVGEPVPKMAKVFIPARPAAAADFPLGTRGVGGRGGGVSFTHVFPADGEYRFNVTEEDYLDMGLYPRGAENAATMVILIDGVEVVRKDVGGPEYLDIADRDGPAGKDVLLAMVSSSAYVKAGRRNVVITFIDRARSLGNEATGNGRATNMPIIQTGLEIEGPFAPQGLSLNDSRARIFVCQPERAAEEQACAEKIARHMATEAFRRPVTDADIAPLMRFYQMGRTEAGGFDSGITELVTAILSSPDFLYRAIPAADQPRLLTDLELATRLSFLMWNTGPDRELLDLASAGRLSDKAVMNGQVDRMLKDRRANAMIENFALAWLNLDELSQVEPIDRAFNEAMRTNFETEIRLFLSSVLLEDRSVRELLDADWTFLNQNLAQHYGVSGVVGPQFRRVQLNNENRFGLLGKGAVLLRTSYADRTSPVLRGAWVLDRIIGSHPAPPPPGVETDLSIEHGDETTTIRARLELHRDNPTCMGCHGIIDPPGLALENFDNTGRWRDVDAAARAPIDASTELSSGLKLNGPIELRNFLMSREDQFPMTVATRLMVYATNRELEYFDMPQVRQIVRDAKAENYTFGSLIKGVVNSDSFRRQGADQPKQTVASNLSGGVKTTP